MRRNLSLELSLFPLCNSDHHMVEDESPMQNYRHHHHQEQQQPLTIFYDGKICAADVTELQAKSILMLANKRMEERVKTPSGSEPSSPTIMQSHRQLNSPGLSMRRSLQQFLQKRRNRTQEASPYNRYRQIS